MTSLHDRALAWGVETRYLGADGHWHAASDATLRGVLRALRADGDGPPLEAPVRVVRTGQEAGLEGPAELVTEDGAAQRVEDRLPHDLPPGYHRLTDLATGTTVRLIASPGVCHLPPDLRAWGWAAQVYATRSAGSWGMGDLADLRRMARWSASLGAGLVMVNPMGAARPSVPQEASPYFPSSRRYRNLLYLRLEEVPGWAEHATELAPLAGQARAANTGRLIDRDAVYEAKATALERLWESFGGDPGFDRYCREEGENLVGYATFCVLHERGEPLPPPDSPEAREVGRSRGDRLRFHQWVQWLLDGQLRLAADELPLVQDLPVGVDPEGADAWLWADVVSRAAQVGAPPDEFNTGGQDWGLPPFDPWRLRAAGYEPFAQTVRSAFRHAGGLRIDHVMGLFRLYWVPAGMTATQGAYVRYPARDLLDVLALESQRAKAFVVGEDLGTVEPGVRDELANRAILSYRLLWFEDAPPSRWPVRALGAVGTHDLPTVAGLWTGSDLVEQRALGMAPNEAGTFEVRDRLRRATGVADDAPVDEVVSATYRLLAEAPSAVLGASLDDALGVEERPNQPGTVSHQRPNWSIALPASLEEIETDPRVLGVAKSLTDRDSRRRG